MSALVELLLLYRHQRKRSAVDVTRQAAGAARKMFSFHPDREKLFFRSSQVPDIIIAELCFTGGADGQSFSCLWRGFRKLDGATSIAHGNNRSDRRDSSSKAVHCENEDCSSSLTQFLLLLLIRTSVRPSLGGFSFHLGRDTF